VTHLRVQLYMRGFAAATEAGKDDRLYCALPLYHATGGLCAVGAALLSGGALLLKKRFSASQFWTDCAEGGATMFVYIGELCRFLVNAPQSADEQRHKIRLAFGNGLRAEVWERMEARFRIPKILEFYGATEGNVSMINFDGKVGAVGRVPRYLRKRFNFRLARFDTEAGEIVRGANGRAQEAKPGEVGEMLGEIRQDDARSNFAGYADKASTERKIARDVFAPGDAWFRTGDLLRQDGLGYFYFIDRVGDTFRWKGENVATGEVAAVLSHVPGVEEADVYGVEAPGAEGRAGMAALVTGEGFDLQALAYEVDTHLPPYARPLFLRLRSAIETTGTFKYRKIDAVEEGFDPSRVRDPLYWREPGGGYVPLDAAAYARIAAGEVRL
jgi:fatty-acyl-CoA synthase